MTPRSLEGRSQRSTGRLQVSKCKGPLYSTYLLEYLNNMVISPQETLSYKSLYPGSENKRMLLHILSCHSLAAAWQWEAVTGLATRSLCALNRIWSLSNHQAAGRHGFYFADKVFLKKKYLVWLHTMRVKNACSCPYTCPQYNGVGEVAAESRRH
jgi:hypothetical protein